jgi:hypothetical protein
VEVETGVSSDLVRGLGRGRCRRLLSLRHGLCCRGLLLSRLRQGRLRFGLTADRVLELAHSRTERTPDFRQPLGAKDQQQDYDQKSDVEWVVESDSS